METYSILKLKKRQIGISKSGIIFHEKKISFPCDDKNLFLNESYLKTIFFVFVDQYDGKLNFRFGKLLPGLRCL